MCYDFMRFVANIYSIFHYSQEHTAHFDYNLKGLDFFYILRLFLAKIKKSFNKYTI